MSDNNWFLPFMLSLASVIALVAVLSPIIYSHVCYYRYLFPNYEEQLKKEKSNLIRKINDLGMHYSVILAKCVEICDQSNTNYWHGRGTGNDSSIQQKAKKNGIWFEKRVLNKLNQLTQEKISVAHQWTVAPGHVGDFYLHWTDVKKNKKSFSILIECKHSVSRRSSSQIKEGIEQLRRYRREASIKRKQKIDLLVLIVNFSVSKDFSLNIVGDIVILNFCLIDEFISGVEEWFLITQRLDLKERCFLLEWI